MRKEYNFYDSNNEEEKTDTIIFIEENNNANEIHNVDHWLQMVENWIKMLDTGNHLDNGKDVDEESLGFELTGHVIYPADNPLTK
ncbi:14134_t:CDS:2 [Funneliformis mosseae]|uniref:14134_t:CDS:1 n=1 Tax=Funneliformis mosseae TaxID=27381 RepID=A0A9N9G5S2_FUNMO|nr:14134_t:CDS:2 [Funneliformis mosseae]